MHATRTALVTATLISAIIFLGMTADSLRKMPARTHSDQISAEVIEGKRLWQHYDCNDCHTILGIGGYFAYAKVLRPPSKRACIKLHDLCSGKVDVDDDKECTEFFETLKKSDAEGSDKTAQCVLDAKSCAQAAGCYAGGAVKLGTGFAKDFLDGMQKSMK